VTVSLQHLGVQLASGAIPQSKPSSVPEPRLVHAAHEFEAAMMKELMAPLLSANNEDGEEEEGSSSALTSYAGEAMAKAISEHGGLGIANLIIRRLSAHGNHSKEPSVPTVSTQDTVK